jgi:cysteine-rich repeat protein
MKSKRLIIAIAGIALAFGAWHLGAPEALAQSATDSLDTVGGVSGLADTDPRIIVARLIRTFLSVVGVVLVVLIIAGGFMWMTAGGDPERVARAKRILIQAIVGFIIIMASWAITTFIIGSLTNSLNNSGSGGGGAGGSGGGGGLGGSGTTSFVVTSMQPQGQLTIKNVSPRVVFSRRLDIENLPTDAITVTNNDDGTTAPIDLNPSLNSIRVESQTACSENDAYSCFNENTSYTLTVSESILSEQGEELACSVLRPCSFNFVTGELVDTEGPRVSITNPSNGQRFNDDEIIRVQATIQDDAGVSAASLIIEDELINTVSYTGPIQTEVTIDIPWDALGYASGISYDVIVEAYDIANNDSFDDVSVRLNPAHCSNGSFDESDGETGVDCGGVCGSCGNDSCADTGDCAGGLTCSSGQCTALPIIEDVLLEGGAPGTFVSITGRYFGGDEGVVYFTGPNDTLVEAAIPQCVRSGWSSTFVTVAVPEGAEDGPITLDTAAGLRDDTSSDTPGRVFDFDVNNVSRPNLCSLDPTSGRSRSFLRVRGEGFGDTRTVEDFLTFDLDERFLFNEVQVDDYLRWESGEIELNVPVLDNGIYLISAVVDGTKSSPLAYRVNNEAETDVSLTGPNLQSYEPGSGAPGTYVTLRGTNFGSRLGTVEFENPSTGEVAIGSFDFPDACADTTWSTGQVIVRVPGEYRNGNPIERRNHRMRVVTAAGNETDEQSFTVNDRDAGPQICLITPDEGSAGDTVTIYGDGLDAEALEIVFTEEAVATLQSKTRTNVLATVPNGRTGEVVARDSSFESNGVQYLFGQTQTDFVPTDASAAGYGWSFSTGTIPTVPELLIECDPEGSGVKSAVPNDAFSPDGACLNSLIGMQFSEPMDFIDASNHIFIEECLNDACTNAQDVDFVRFIDTGNLLYAYRFDGEVLAWKPSTTYRVVVDDEFESARGIPTDEEYTWFFTTREGEDGDVCTVNEIVLTPESVLLERTDETSEVKAMQFGGDACQPVYSSGRYTFSVSSPVVDLNQGGCGSPLQSCVRLTPLQEGEATLQAQFDVEDSGFVRGTADIEVRYAPLTVERVFPACTSACSNAAVGAQFSVPIDITSMNSTPNSFNVVECLNELCTQTLENIATSGSCQNDACDIIQANVVGDMKPDTYYKVILAPTLRSISGSPLTGLNDTAGYSWIFRSSGDGACTVARVEVSPEEVTTDEVGARSVFTAIPYSEPDDCSVAGQVLNSSINWSFEDPITNEAGVAGWIDTFIDGGGAIADGCSESCLPFGSSTVSAVCGNGITEYGETCDDGNFTDGDGCSSICLSEGSGSGGLCGDGALNRLTNGAGEECDDGNTNDGDGCSASCTNEGARTLRLTCGDGQVAFDPAVGGEECDDGNTASGDGCSSNCLFEGSTPANQIAGSAICGDGTVTIPYEMCDDGNNIDGDGCSSSCLFEGSDTCGNGIVEYGEHPSCEENGGIGCDARCLPLGSSLRYETPSVCGDGVVGFGEVATCESSGGDGNIDASQIAEILDSAPALVSTETNEVSATIRVNPATQSTIVGEATFTLSCAAQEPSDCSDPYTFGVSDSGCCVQRPFISNMQPQERPICRNAAVSFQSDVRLDIDSLEGEVGIVYRSENGACPEGHEVFTPDVGFIERMLESLRSAFAIPVLAQSDPLGRIDSLLDSGRQQVGVLDGLNEECIMPIDRIEESRLADDLYRYQLYYGNPLAPNASYSLYIGGDEDVFDDAKEGIESVLGVAIDGSRTQSFLTGNEICSVSGIDLRDTAETPFFFSSLNEEPHELNASPYTIAGGLRQDVQPLPGVYDWDWNDYRVSLGGDDVVAVDESEGADDSDTLARPVAESGSAYVQASLVETVGGDRVVDTYENITALLCENPWPRPQQFPFYDGPAEDGRDQLPQQSSQQTLTSGSEAGFSHFSSYFCRDAGESGGADDLPSLILTVPPRTSDNQTLREFLFRVADGSGDAIGVRVVANPEYLNLNDWYAAQGFEGNPGADSIANLPALRDGRTVYIQAPNVNDEGLVYQNVYIFTYNQLASETTVEIFNQFINNLAFTLNVEDTPFCSLDATQSCVNDAECIDAGICQNSRTKLSRDMRRIVDVVTYARQTNDFGITNGYCSLTQSQSCTSATECPAGESCQPAVPQLDSGTSVRGLSSSAWSSWSSLYAGPVGYSAIDPLNQYSSCDPAIAEDNCINADAGTYICTEDSYVYHYQQSGLGDFVLGAQLETDSPWGIPVPTFERGRYALPESVPLVDDADREALFCGEGRVYGDSSVCGDGVVGAGEVCEPGSFEDQACSLTDGSPGSVRAVCANDCSGFIVPDDAVCQAGSCGNGVVEPALGETCDDGAQNGQYGFCGGECQIEDSLYCGDGILSAGEACDCGADGSGRAIGGGACAGPNGAYDASGNLTCSFDCRAIGPFCGDGVVQTNGNPPEQCDGNIETWSGQLCLDGSACASNADCTDGSTCGDGALACGSSRVCVAGDSAKVGNQCSSDRACDTVVAAGEEPVLDGQCSNQAVPLTRTRTCNNATCSWNQSAFSINNSQACKAAATCGNGQVEEGEQCDDGNAANGDGCTNSCQFNVCGDGFLYSGVEECDAGTQNGEFCSAGYGSTCSYCASSCQKRVLSGSFCGDGIRNGSEVCDLGSVALSRLDADSGRYLDVCRETDDINTVSGAGICVESGICSGGDRDGEACLGPSSLSAADQFGTDLSCGTGECVLPSCQQDCRSQCPYVYDQIAVGFLSGERSSTAASSVRLTRLDALQSSSPLDNPDSATLLLPACNVYDGFVGGIVYENIQFDPIDVVFLLDMSGSMDNDFSGSSESKLDILKESVKDGADELFNQLGDVVRVKYSTYSAPGTAGHGQVSEWYGIDDLTEFEESVEDLVAGGGTRTGLGMEELLDATEWRQGSKRITVVVTDGAIGDLSPSPLPPANDLACDDYSTGDRIRRELYYLTIGYVEAPASMLRGWERTCPGDRNAEVSDYSDLCLNQFEDQWYDWYNINQQRLNTCLATPGSAYFGSSEDDFKEAFSEIIRSIASVDINFLVNEDGDIREKRVSAAVGQNTELPKLDGLFCASEAQRVPFTLDFHGTGTVLISNMRARMCR